MLAAGVEVPDDVAPPPLQPEIVSKSQGNAAIRQRDRKRDQALRCNETSRAEQIHAVTLRQERGPGLLSGDAVESGSATVAKCCGGALLLLCAGTVYSRDNSHLCGKNYPAEACSTAQAGAAE